MKFLVDNQLPPALAIELRRRGHDCQHVLDVNMDRAIDVDLWSACSTEGRVIVSKDEDFVFLANRPADTGRLVWVRLGNCRNAVLLQALDRAHDAMVAALESGQRIVEIR
jgi:predicted nuclease of predicted toxin-antitoxin system